MNVPSAAQTAICERFGATPSAPAPSEKVGIALDTLHQLPLNALRHVAENGTCGWYIWAGEELSEAPEFFSPLHVAHLAKHVPTIVPYIALPPGWRVLLAPGHEDVWFDGGLLEVRG